MNPMDEQPSAKPLPATPAPVVLPPLPLTVTQQILEVLKRIETYLITPTPVVAVSDDKPKPSKHRHKHNHDK